MRQYLKLLKKAKNIALISHTNPDPDTIGSTLALSCVLKRLGKSVSLFCDAEYNENYSFLSAYKEYEFSGDADFSAYDLIVAVDVANDTMLGKFAEQFALHENTLRIDHHASGTDYAKNNLVIPYSACAILVFEIAKKLKVKIDKDMATMLYFAICGDTGIFRNNNTDSVTFEVCAELFKAGAEYRKVYSEFFDKKTVPFIKLTANTILNASINDELKFVIMTVTSDDYKKFDASTNENIGNIPHQYLNCGYNIAVVLKEKEDGIHCSFRSKFEYDCSKIAEAFGGGGHKNASGCKIEKDIKSAKKDVENEIIKYLSAREES